MKWMHVRLDPQMQWIFGGVLVLMVVASLIGCVLARVVKGESGRKVVDNLNARTRAWWVMAAVFAMAVVVGPIGTVVLFGLLSFLALREFVTLVPTSRGDHRALFWSF